MPLEYAERPAAGAIKGLFKKGEPKKTGPTFLRAFFWSIPFPGEVGQKAKGKVVYRKRSLSENGSSLTLVPYQGWIKKLYAR